MPRDTVAGVVGAVPRVLADTVQAGIDVVGGQLDKPSQGPGDVMKAAGKVVGKAPGPPTGWDVKSQTGVTQVHHQGLVHHEHSSHPGKALDYINPIDSPFSPTMDVVKRKNEEV
jgi:hypothetical protein